MAKYSLRYLLGPTAMTSLIMGSSMAAIAAGKSTIRGDIFIWGGIGSLVGIYIGVAWVTPEIFKAVDPEIMTRFYELKHGYFPGKSEEKRDITIVSESGNEGIYLKNVSVEQWVEAARKIVDHEYEFSVGVLGRPLHDAIRTEIKNKDCLCSINPNNTLTLTQMGRSLFDALYPEDNAHLPTTVNDVPVFVRRWLK